MKFFDTQNQRLIFIKQEATPDFWDKQWNIDNFPKSIKSGRNERFVFPITSQYLPPNKQLKILEGGCGKGNFVYSLATRGYDAYGIDFASETIKKINAIVPELKVSEADVRKLPFESNFFDGYWSLGVIEHFYEGYHEIAEEIARVLKPGGYLFLTFPYMSPLRKIKAKLGYYPIFIKTETAPDNFYQFALDHKKVADYFIQMEFDLIKQKPFEGFKGMKDESFPLLKRLLQKIYDNKSIVARIIGFLLSHIFAPVSGHAILLVLRKR